MQFYEYDNQKMAYLHHGSGESVYIWVHGWGSDHNFLKGLSQSLTKIGTHYIVDIPGFGQSPKPSEDWDLQNYADFFAKFIESLDANRVIWVGHSYGCRIGIKLASIYPKLIDQMALIAAAGLPQKRSLFEKIRIFIKVRTFKLMKLFVTDEKKLEELRSRHGSSDYREAGEMRKIFVKTFSENLENDARAVKCPVALYYGELDEATKPDMGRRFQALIPNSQFEEFKGLDHFSIVLKGHSQLAQRIKKFVETKIS
ncbi:MAG: alpha/beta hydrolase [Pseudomonadota bacterium]